MIAVVSILVSLMSDTFVSANKDFSRYNWNNGKSHLGLAIAMFLCSAFVKSGSNLSDHVPFGIALAFQFLLLGLIPASYAYFFFCIYPSDLAAINMDRTVTTR
jgi:anaerobic C4-dicarboxylate transporter DcuB